MIFQPPIPAGLFPFGRMLLCPPTYFDVRYEINPWMSTGRTPQAGLVAEQWRNLHHILIRLGAYVEYIHQHADSPDQVFTANAGLVKGDKVVLSRFKHKERQGEEPYFKRWFEERGYTVLEIGGGVFEGEGDALFAGGKLFAGYGIRSERAVYDQVAAFLELEQYVPCELTDKSFYHLDLAFCPLRGDLALCYEGGLAPESVRRIHRELEVIAVPEEDALRFVCNSVVLGNDVVMPARCPWTIAALETRGFTCHVVEVSEFQKGGGAVKCLVLHLDRRA